ncbi:MAG: UDP-3-O-[3-hydroxymyristoyl] glucosamine N-acyltransferase [Candidatus Marinamargulisbacteria bacterium]|jgi:UDP-3-O-[3-hydroxymyristoyl] glucosamine N-acyltransferase
MRLADIAKALDGELIGDANIDVSNVAALDTATATELSFVLESQYIAEGKSCKATAYVTFKECGLPNQIVVKNGRKALAQAIALFHPAPPAVTGQQHKTAIINEKACLAEAVNVGAYACIDALTSIGEGTTIKTHVVIGKNCQIGKNCIIYPSVVIYDDTIIGDNVILQAGAVIGSDGFGYYQDEGKNYKVPHIGRVVIEDDVEICANTCVARGCLDETRIGKNTKIDNLVQVAHNVTIGKHCLIAGLAGLNGHAKLGDFVSVGGQAGVASVEVGSQVMIAAKAGVTHNISGQQVISGFPAWNHKSELKKEAFLRQLLKRKEKNNR